MQTTLPQPQSGFLVAPQQPAAVSFPTTARPTADENHKKIIRGISIAEIVLGALSIISGGGQIGTISSIRYFYYYYYRFPVMGQGIWCGVWVLVAGVIGVVAGGSNSNSCKVNTYMGFAINASVFAGIQLILDICTALNFFVGASAAFIVISGLCSLAALILCIVSAIYSCKLTSSCCQSTPSTQMLYYTANAQPVHTQGLPGTTQAYVFQPAPQQVIQQPMQPVMMGQNNLAYTPVVHQPTGVIAQFQNSAAVPHKLEATHLNQKEAMQLQLSVANNQPPVYS